MAILKLYKKPAFTATKTNEVLQKLQQKNANVVGLETELCFYVELEGGLKGDEREVLRWVLQNSFEPELLGEREFLKVAPPSGDVIIEVRIRGESGYIQAVPFGVFSSFLSRFVFEMFEKF